MIQISNASEYAKALNTLSTSPVDSEEYETLSKAIADYESQVFQIESSSPNETISLENFLQEVSQELAYNYFSVSFGETHREKLVVAGIDNEEELRNAILSEGQLSYLEQRGYYRARTILVIGAGATKGAFNAFPLGSETKRMLADSLHLTTLLDTNAALKSYFFSEAARIATLKEGKIPVIENLEDHIYDRSEFDFESFLLLLTKIFREQDIRNALSNIFQLRYAPVLFYETCAHLLKNRFLDVIINFNFDEMLDQAIIEEMGNADFNQILYDGHCKDLSELVVDGRLKIPLYIKPHGTISHKHSMRFTKNQYFDLPDEIRKLLTQLIGGELDKGSANIERINIFTIGFNMESIEFNDIILKNKSNVKMYSVVHGKNEVPKFLKENRGLYTKSYSNSELRLLQLEKKRPDISELYKKHGGSIRSSDLDKIGFVLMKYIQNNFKAIYKPKDISRHVIVSSIFYKKHLRTGSDIASINSYFNSYEYFENRVIIELAIELAWTNGRIELKELMNDRVGHYYSLYRKFYQNQYGYDKPAKSAYEIANIFSTTEALSFSRNILSISESSLEERKVIGKWRPGPKESKDENPCHFLAKKLIYTLLQSKSTPQSLKDLFEDKDDTGDNIVESTIELLEEICSRNNPHTISPKFSAPKLYIFDHFYKDQILHTDLSLKYRFNEVFTAPQHWDYLLVVSDMGLFFKDALESESFKDVDIEKLYKNKKIYLITCLESIKQQVGKFEELDSLLQNHIANKIDPKIQKNVIHKTLPYTEHHHHMAIFLKRISDSPTKSATKGSVVNLSEYPTIQVTHKDGKTENFILVRSIYYYKKGFSNKINPIWVRGAFAFLKNPKTPIPGNFSSGQLVKDNLMLLETFYAYHKKAQSFKASNGEYVQYLLPKDMDITKGQAEDNLDTDFRLHSKEERAFDLSKLFTFLRDYKPKE